MSEVIVDSHLSPAEAIGNKGPEQIRKQQRVLTVRYISFDDLEHQGQIVVNHELRHNVIEMFAVAFQLKFPIEKVIPASQFGYDDEKLMSANVTSGFNYRTIVGTDELSPHATGRAIDVNPRLNPYTHKVGGQVVTEPAGAEWDPKVPGTFCKDHPLVHFMKSRGWIWGGDWTVEETGRADYHHFEKRA